MTEDAQKTNERRWRTVFIALDIVSVVLIAILLGIIYETIRVTITVPLVYWLMWIAGRKR